MFVLPTNATTGQTALNRILSFAYSTAMDFVAFEAAALEALYLYDKSMQPTLIMLK